MHLAQWHQLAVNVLLKITKSPHKIKIRSNQIPAVSSRWDSADPTSTACGSKRRSSWGGRPKEDLQPKARWIKMIIRWLSKWSNLQTIFKNLQNISRPILDTPSTATEIWVISQETRVASANAKKARSSGYICKETEQKKKESTMCAGFAVFFLLKSSACGKHVKFLLFVQLSSCGRSGRSCWVSVSETALMISNVF